MYITCYTKQQHQYIHALHANITRGSGSEASDAIIYTNLYSGANLMQANIMGHPT